MNSDQFFSHLTVLNISVIIY